MPDGAPLEARSPFELRVNLGRGVGEAEVRQALASGDMGFLHSFTTGATVDGPGVRVVAWTSGCMWRCQYCHNPDTWTMTNGLPVSIARAADELGKYRHGLKVMAGGFTLSGGEPLMQHRFAVKLLSAAKQMGIHTALDTNGFYGDRLSDAELELIDLVLLDIKTWDPHRHRALTGADNAPTLEFARRLAARGRSVSAPTSLSTCRTRSSSVVTRVATSATASSRRPIRSARCTPSSATSACMSAPTATSGCTARLACARSARTPSWRPTT